MTLTTERLRAGAEDPGAPDLERAAAILRRGGTVAFATETVYGLGANALDPEAVQRIFTAKQRPSWDPLIVHIADLTMLHEVGTELPAAAQLLARHFWPGPLTLLVPRNPGLPQQVTAGRALVGLRMPAHPVALALIRAAGVPVAAPSANSFGHVSPTTAEHVAADLDGRIDAILDSGETLHGLESTVLDTSVEPCIVYRPGALSVEQLRAVWPAIQVYAGAPGSAEPPMLPSPGMGLRHYAPRARLLLVEGEGAYLVQALETALVKARAIGSTALMQPSGFPVSLAQADRVYAWGDWSNLATLAHRLFAGLRALDDLGAAVIVCPLPAPSGLGLAIRDRLLKAARQS